MAASSAHYSPAVVAGIVVVPLLCLWGALENYQAEAAYQEQFHDPYMAWTKDEGLLFLAVFLAATALFRRRGAHSAVAGALPAIAVVALFKTVLSRGNPSLLSTSVAERPTVSSTWGATAL